MLWRAAILVFSLPSAFAFSFHRTRPRPTPTLLLKTDALPPDKTPPAFAMDNPLQQCLSRHRMEAAWDSQHGAYVTSDAHGGRLFTRYVEGREG